MKSHYPIKWLPATPEYILAGFQEEWRQFALFEAGYTTEELEQRMPSFHTTIKQWCDDAILDEWVPLNQALNEAWDTKFSRKQWREVLEPACEKTLRGVCELLASQVQRPLLPRAKLLGRNCPTARVFLAIRSMLVKAGAPANIRPSSAIEPYLRKWPKVFQEKVARLSLGGLPFKSKRHAWRTFASAGSLAGVLLLILRPVFKLPEIVIFGVIIFAAGWIAGACFRWPLTLENVNTFRDLAELIVKKQQAYGFNFK